MFCGIGSDPRLACVFPKVPLPSVTERRHRKAKGAKMRVRRRVKFLPLCITLAVAGFSLSSGAQTAESR
jgi:hypothetical protein